MSENQLGQTEAGTGFQLREKPVVAGPEDTIAITKPVEDSTPETVTDVDNLGELPYSYGSDTLFLVAQEPRWLFTYWDIDISRHPGGQSYLRVHQNDTLESEIEVPFESRNWYIPVKNPGAEYVVEIGYYRGDAWKRIAESKPVLTPTDKISESEAFDYASIPLHLSFEKLTDSIKAAIRSGESLMYALSRLQQQPGFVGNLSSVLPEILASQRLILEALLGRNLLEELTSGGFGSEEIEKRIREYLEQHIASGGASELLNSQVFQSSSLSSLGLLPVFSGEQSTSWNAAALSSWATAALSSWAAASSALGGETSWGKALSSSWSAETLSSLTQSGASSLSVAELSSWLQGIQSSWFQSAQSSWAQAALSSWNQAALSSWSKAVGETSWSGGSETLSSPGFAGGRSFFMHINAEVIFYGGTDPRAKVTIDGNPVPLNADGTFRYHFVFPDGVYEIPIVAVSPDGIETRSAILRFERGTQKHGGVDDTAQPPLTAPMGAKS